MSYADKLKGFPSVYTINLEESVDRREYMINQFIKYGIKYNIFTTPRYVTFKDDISVDVDTPTKTTLPNLHIGATISFVSIMNDWYNNTDEEYAIFCEDDVSFESIEHWNFTWEEFYSKIPKQWECLQLIRMSSDIRPSTIDELQLDFRWGRWWGSSFMFRRSHVKRLLDILYVGRNKYRITSQDGAYDPCVENCLSFNYNTVCNFPLLFENNFNLDPVDGKDLNANESKLISNYIIRHYWKTVGKNLNLDDAMIER